MSLHRIAVRLAHPRLPRRTVRLRLTLLYGGLFLLSAIGLLAVTYALMRNATSGLYVYKGPQGGNFGTVVGSAAPSHQRVEIHSNGGLTSQQLREQSDLLRNQAVHQRADQLHQLLIQSGIALAIGAVISIALGWIVAGRILRRLRTITATARDISATNLNKRLALDGPGDELKELGDTIDGLLARLETSFQAQRQFIANASHELRTPLARQRTLTQVALADPNPTVRSLQETHERVLAAAAQQEHLIAALLTLARGQAGIDVREPFDLGRLTGQVLTARRLDAEQRGLTLKADLSRAPVMGDPRLAERLVTNLVDNALRHNTADGRVDVVARVEAGRTVLSVTNTGPAVPANAVDRLFQPFQRLGSERTGRPDGLGLGLSIVQAIADAHDAVVTAHPRPAGGLTIEVRFPAPDHPGHDDHPHAPRVPARAAVR